MEECERKGGGREGGERGRIRRESSVGRRA